MKQKREMENMRKEIDQNSKQSAQIDHLKQTVDTQKDLIHQLETEIQRNQIEQKHLKAQLEAVQKQKNQEENSQKSIV